MRRYFVIFLTAVLIFITYLTNFFIHKKKEAGENLLLKQENQELRAQIQKVSVVAEDVELASKTAKRLPAVVFSVYPFNIKSEVTISLGEEDAIKDGGEVTLGDNILVGEVSQVFRRESAVKTIFDSSFEMPVRVGEKSANGLLQGGNEPKVILVEKNKDVQIGDLIYSADARFSYGLKIGEVNEIRELKTGAFKELTVKTPFNVSELRRVLVRISD
ncbi:rod shape-determining protein MreC [Candidatus Wolfebacteria bacterium]|nr:rod shape-determining protein MreC [Candidatus Wolfebacteria bacterium]